MKTSLSLPHLGNNIHGFEDFCLKNGSSQGQNMVLTISYVPNSIGGTRLSAPPRFFDAVACATRCPTWEGLTVTRAVQKAVTTFVSEAFSRENRHLVPYLVLR